MDELSTKRLAILFEILKSLDHNPPLITIKRGYISKKLGTSNLGGVSTFEIR